MWYKKQASNEKWLRKVFFCFFACCVFAGSPVHGIDKANLQSGIAHISQVEGKLFLEKPHSGEMLRLKEGMNITGHYELITREKSTAVIHFSNGSSLKIKPDTHLTVEGFMQKPHTVPIEQYTNQLKEPSSSYLSVYVRDGGVMVHAASLNPKSFFYIQSPQIYGKIRGTIFTLDSFAQEQRSSIGVYEGKIASMVKTALSQNQKDGLLRAITDIQSDLSPLEAVIGGGQTLTVESRVRDIAITMDHISADEARFFQGEASELADEMGIPQTTMRDAIANANAGKPQVDGTPARLSTIQSNSIMTNRGPGFEITIRTADDGSLNDGTPGPAFVETIEKIVGVEIEDPDGFPEGSTRTITRKNIVTVSNASDEPLGSGLEQPVGTVYTATIDDVQLPDGSFEKSSNIESLTFDNAPVDFPGPDLDLDEWLDANGEADTAVLGQPVVTHEYESETVGNGDGTFVKEADSSFDEDADGNIDITLDETVSAAFDENEQLLRTVERSINGGATQTFVDPMINFSTITIESDPDDRVLFDAQSFDEEGNPIGNSTATITYGDDQKSGTVTKTDDAGNTETEDFEFETSDGSTTISREIENDPEPAPIVVVNEEITIERLENGGSRQTEFREFSDGTDETIVTLKEIADNSVETISIFEDGTLTSREIRTPLDDGTIRVERDTDGDGTIDEVDTERRNRATTEPGEGGEGEDADDEEIDDAIDEAEDNTGDDPVASD